jgi:O-antigen/teichoic acid export membrane protein
VALTESQNPDRPARMTMAALPAQVRAKVHSWLADGSDRSLAQKVAGGAFLIRVFSAGLIYLSQILLARWMGSFEFGIYVYVWTLVLMIGDLADLGLATAAQRFIPEYTRRKANDLLRGYL